MCILKNSVAFAVSKKRHFVLLQSLPLFLVVAPSLLFSNILSCLAAFAVRVVI